MPRDVLTNGRTRPARNRRGVRGARTVPEPRQAAVFEDALAGVAAGRAGAFACVVAVDRTGEADELREHAADVVVTDLSELLDS
jgi:beta-phosphoglucomutase-like phosphatase (HAD superfamily)